MHELFSDILGFVFEFALDFLIDIAGELFNSGARKRRES